MATILSTILLLSVIILSMLFPSKSDVLEFNADLIPRDSPASPFYDPSLNRIDHVRNALRRSHDRANHFLSPSKDVNAISSHLSPSSGAYIMRIALGTPPVTMFLTPDTSSDLTWMQCEPCIKCSEQEDPLYNPQNSSTYKPYPYDSAECRRLGLSFEALNDTCGYMVSYRDGSYSIGILASETLAPGSISSIPVYFSGITFGCGLDNEGAFGYTKYGLVGLGGGPISLVSQIKPSIYGRFLYCLTPGFTEKLSTSQIKFGKDAVVSGTMVASTPIIPKQPSTYYYLNLEALSVGKHKIKLFESKAESIINAGNIIIDMSTTLTHLHNSTYVKFVDLVRKYMGNKTVPDPFEDLELLCYRISDKPSYPKIMAYFHGASVELKPINTFIEVDYDVTCLAFAPAETIQVYGNVAQTNFLVGYDTVKGRVSFKPHECGVSS